MRPQTELGIALVVLTQLVAIRPALP